MRALKKIINLNALRHNWALIKQRSLPATPMVVLKADAYGHGMTTVAKTLDDARYFAVSCIEEAIALRHLGIDTPVVLLEGVYRADELLLCEYYQFDTLVHNFRQMQWLKEFNGSVKAWLKVDSGMHRLGFTQDEIAEALAQAHSLPVNIQWQGVITHFACSDEDDLTHAKKQLACMDRLVLPAHWKRCYANSAAIFALPQAHYDYTRSGIMLYGLSPFMHGDGSAYGLQPVMTVITEILAVRHLEKNETAGYGQGFTAPESGWLATIALGYGDGFARTITSGAVPVLIAGQRYPLVGRVAMDMAMVWLGSDRYAEGTIVELFGSHLPTEEVARAAGTIPHTLTTMLMPRVHVEIVGG